ncbi:MAG TPA: hypothetical protein VK752_11130 [Bryobacteraceae bacterium]|jgi:hypothetical protein|nr:hypothetical protein [Bryobacteraceae bacterium]
MSTTTLDFGTFEALYEFNKNIHHGVLCLEALTRHDGFDRATITMLATDVVKAKCAANAYLISVIGAAEGEGAATVAAARRRNVHDAQTSRESA